MFRNLVLIVAIVLLIWIVRGFIRRSQITRPTPKTLNKDMVQCEHCQTYLPKDEAIEMDNHFFCGQQHLEDWKKDS